MMMLRLAEGLWGPLGRAGGGRPLSSEADQGEGLRGGDRKVARAARGRRARGADCHATVRSCSGITTAAPAPRDGERFRCSVGVLSAVGGTLLAQHYVSSCVSLPRTSAPAPRWGVRGVCCLLANAAHIAHGPGAERRRAGLSKPPRLSRRLQTLRGWGPADSSLMREAQLLAPTRLGHAHGPKAHDGTITTEGLDQMWGMNATSCLTRREGAATVFVVVDHCAAEWPWAGQHPRDARGPGPDDGRRSVATRPPARR
jgi:hypothetical protein